MTRRSDELEKQARALDDAPEWSADEAECIDLEEQDIAARCKTIRDGLKTWAPDAMAHAGAIVTVSREGDAEVIRGLVRDADRRAFGRIATMRRCRRLRSARRRPSCRRVDSNDLRLGPAQCPVQRPE